MPEIQFFGVSKFYGNVKAVEDLNFTIQEGEYLSLLGPSGCGKTTTLRMISGLILPTEGKIVWDGKQVQDVQAADRDVGYVFQQFAIFPHLTIWENIAFGPKAKGFPKKEIEQSVEEYIKLVGLSDIADAYPSSLSAANKQRTGIARVLATGAKTLLLDEPMGALDSKIREHFQDELLNIVKSLGLTAIHVTHDQSEALAISDRVGVMKKGKLVQIASPDELLFNPNEVFASYFIGETDVFEGIIRKINTESVMVELLGDEVITIDSKRANRITPTVGQKVIIGIRREFFSLLPYDESQISDTDCFQGTVVADRFQGEKIRTKVKLDYGRELEVKRSNSGKRYKFGDKVLVKIEKNTAFLFMYPSLGLEQEISVT